MNSRLAEPQLQLGFEVQRPSAVGLPLSLDSVLVPPLKCQGIKTKLVKFILSSIRWSGTGRWIEPFMGSGSVAFNLAPPKALFVDSNTHVIRLYEEICSGKLTPDMVREHLNKEGSLLWSKGGEHYYSVRERFNRSSEPLDFLFLNRACFNGVIRFNRKGEFNVPWGKKPERFRPAYVTKVVNQVTRIANLAVSRDWRFLSGDWRDAIDAADPGDFVYADPPYYGRHTGYFDTWSEGEARDLMVRLDALPCGYALSTWQQNKYRSNPQLEFIPKGAELRTQRHFYHVGSSEELRNEMIEALVIHGDYAVPPDATS